MQAPPGPSPARVGGLRILTGYRAPAPARLEAGRTLFAVRSPPAAGSESPSPGGQGAWPRHPHRLTPSSLPLPLRSAWRGGQEQAGRRAERSVSAGTPRPGGCRPDKGPHGQPHVRLLSPAPVSLSCRGGRARARGGPPSRLPLLRLSAPVLSGLGESGAPVARAPGPAGNLDQAVLSHQGLLPSAAPLPSGQCSL